MGRIWIVNPFDPLPGSDEQSGRYASLARMLRDAGHQVLWWTASFSHRFKRELDHAAVTEACRRENISVRILPVRPYQKNVSLRRIRSHADYTRQWTRAAAAEPAPDVIIASNPLPQTAAAAGRFCRQTGSRLVVDVQDAWVRSFRRMFPKPVRWAWPAILRSWIRADRQAYQRADAVVGVANEYADEPARNGRASYRRGVIPLGAPLAEFDAAVRRGHSLLGPKPPGAVWVMYSGSFSLSYDVITLAQMATRFRDRPNIRFIFSGRGDLEPRLRETTAGQSNVTWLGFAAFDDWAATLAQCDVGCNAIDERANVFFPNKVFFYWSAGLAILNSLPGECADWIRRTRTGITYPTGDVAGAQAALQQLVRSPVELAGMKSASRISAEQIWDRQRLYRPYVALVNELASDPTRHLA